MELKGYSGAGLWVNLSTGAIKKKPLDSELAMRFVGGSGLTNKLGYDLISPEVEPLSPENIVIIGSTSTPSDSSLYSQLVESGIIVIRDYIENVHDQ